MIDQTEPSYALLRQRRSVDLFAGAVVISFILHIFVSALLSLPGRFSGPVSAPVFVELSNVVSLPDAAESPLPGPPQTADALSPEQPLPQDAFPEAERLDRSIESSLRRAVQAPEAVHESAIGLGMTAGHFASFAEGESLKDDIRVYYFSLMRRINEVWWLSNTARGSFTSAASVNIHISREGKVLACELLESSGSREQDQALLDAVKRAEPLPPLPRSFIGRVFTAPIRFVPPLRLMFPGYPSNKVSPH